MYHGFGLAHISHLVLFGLTALACFGMVVRVRTQIDDPDVQWGLASLLALCGFWSAFSLGRLSVPLPELKLTFYMLGLIVGLSTVGAWLYFCSAFTGRTYHQESIYRWTAFSLFLIIVAVKVTSPIHGLYFTTSSPTSTELVIELGTVHWVVAGFAYALSAIGFYMLFDLFKESNYVTTKLSVLVGLAGVSGVFTVYAYLNPTISTVSYEPVGVALFALGVLNFADGTFLAVQRFGREQLIDELNEAIIILDSDGIIQDVNDPARRLFPSLSDAIGKSVATEVPELTEYLSVESPQVITVSRSNVEKHYLLSTQTLTAGETIIGRTVVCTDITELERQRGEIKRHRNQRNEFAEAITHELRNAINVTNGHLELVQTHLNSEEDSQTANSLNIAVSMTDRMEQIVCNLAMIAEYGQPVEETLSVDLGTIAQEGWEMTSSSNEFLQVPTSEMVEADPTRLKKLFETLFTFCLSNGATEVKIEVMDGTIVVTDNGKPLTETDAERAFAYGEAVPDAKSGMQLPVVRTLADAHGWNVTIETAYQGGVRIRIVT
ncbi:histidine kinase N-terminal 7TM domain-containing protein [Natranaeroarchaeum sulfidigenes]|uniref:histidine kinase n=1 Tax=Natranaeroarchaeum sulfidigenes TaxID=2784880 RepID=A0A897MR36_9EURY|nr:histidine kinase N-terminal 7TM domain-containing protein [Natranaeroarchaeum sulfidigenes]QSG02882.1 Signal transduction histidine kinase, contains PAS domain [Natranaeroarchaeum sulfidigenes]